MTQEQTSLMAADDQEKDTSRYKMTLDQALDNIRARVKFVEVAASFSCEVDGG
jgi:hypothetical protein